MTHNMSTLLDEYGLSRARDKILALALPSIRIRATRTNEMDMEVGVSKIGGQPDLPVDTDWPKYQGRPLSFLAQINLSEIRQSPVAEQLPSHGLLSFFYDALEQPWGFDPADAGRWGVLHFEDETARLVRTEWPDELDDEGRFDACELFFEDEADTIPPYRSYLTDRFELTDDERDRYFELLSVIEEEQVGQMHRLLGHPDAIQGDMQIECELATNGVYLGNVISYDAPELQELKRGWAEWRSLLQLDSEDNAGMMWGDMGRLYFWIRAEALAARRFEECWVILQCT